jgi:hypothetical protein
MPVGRPLGKTRNPAAVFLFSLITFGIYYLVWWYKINREVREFDPTITVEPGISVVAITLGGCLIVPPFVSTFNTGTRIAQAQASGGQMASCSGGLGLLLWIIFVLNTLYYQSELNKLWASQRPPTMAG